MYPQVLNPVEQVDFAFWFILGIAVFMLVGITICMIWFTWKYDFRRNPEPAQIDGNLFLEILWTVIPLMVVMGMFYFGWTGFKALRTVPSDALQIKAKARMWSWMFIYENGKIASECFVPQGKPVKVTCTSDDVLHSFYVPAFRIKIDCVPGMETYAWFRPENVGTFTLLCAEYCGLKHADMISWINVLPPADFDHWLKQTGEPASGATAPDTEHARLAKKGRKVLMFKGCLGCHSTDGSAMPGPTLKGLWGKRTLVIRDGRETEVVEDEAHLTQSILEPGLDMVKGFETVMPKPDEMTPQDLKSIIEYLKDLQ